MALQEQGGYSSWVRFDAYELANEYVGPVKGGVPLEYDPWRELREARGRKGVTEAPYQSLLRLPVGLGIDITRPAPSSPAEMYKASLKGRAEHAIERWTRHHGLLGILPQHYRQIVLPAIAHPRYDPDGQLRLAVVIRRHVRTARGWITESSTFQTDNPLEEHIVQHLQDRGLLPESSKAEKGRTARSLPAQAIQQDLLDELPLVDRKSGWRRPRGWMYPGADEGGPVWASLSSVVSTFFPSVPKEETALFQVPLPLTSEFWQIYQEPVQAFVYETLAFVRSVIATAEEFGATDAPKHGMVARERQWFDELCGSAAIVLDRGEGDEIRQRQVYPSLLSAFAAMARDDFAAGYRLRICQECGAPYLSQAYQSTYCSARCRYAIQKRRHRRKKRQQKQTNKEDV